MRAHDCGYQLRYDVVGKTCSEIKIYSSVLFFPIESNFSRTSVLRNSITSKTVCMCVKVKVNQSHYRPEVPRGFQEVKVPRLRNNGPEW